MSHYKGKQETRKQRELHQPSKMEASDCLSPVNVRHEKCEVSEVNMEHFKKCPKHEDQDKMIEVNKFMESDLEEKYRDRRIFELLQTFFKLVVRIAVTKENAGRPPKTGTGTIVSVLSSHDEANQKNCPCRSCRKAKKTNKVWWEIKVLTASHVVCDDAETKNTICRLFFDEENSEIVTIDGFRALHTEEAADKCSFVCATCNASLVKTINQNLSNFEELTRTLPRKFKKSNIVGSLSVIVSHPHGLFKHVSLGQVKEVSKRSANHCVYKYSNRTCVGSSGAVVYTLGKRLSELKHVHSESISLDEGLSSIGHAKLSFKLVHFFEKMKHLFLGCFLKKKKQLQ